MHYNEFQAVKLARQLIEDEYDDNDGNCDEVASASSYQPETASSEAVPQTGDTETDLTLKEDMVWLHVWYWM